MMCVDTPYLIFQPTTKIGEKSVGVQYSTEEGTFISSTVYVVFVFSASLFECVTTKENR